MQCLYAPTKCQVINMMKNKNPLWRYFTYEKDLVDYWINAISGQVHLIYVIIALYVRCAMSWQDTQHIFLQRERSWDPCAKPLMSRPKHMNKLTNALVLVRSYSTQRFNQCQITRQGSIILTTPNYHTFIFFIYFLFISRW